MRFGGVVYNRTEILNDRPGSADRFMQIDDDHYIGPSGELDDLLNHSCDPNAGVRFLESGVFLVSLRAIKPGEELCFDYSTTSSGSAFCMPCLCGTANCRKVIGDFEFLEPDLQEHYRKLGVVAPYLQVDHVPTSDQRTEPLAA